MIVFENTAVTTTLTHTHTLKYIIQCPEIDRRLLKDPIHGSISRSLVYFS